MFRLQLQIRVGHLLVAVIPGLFFVGCAADKNPTAKTNTVGGWYSVTKDQTAFYQHGPQQGNGPDSELPRDSIMKVIRPSFGFVKVQLQDGQNGYVSNEDIGPANPSVVAEKLAPPPPVPEPVIASHDEQFQLDSNDPRLIAPPEPLPEASPKPQFRY